ncbi:MAG TPA: Error-prone repair protein ImuA [Chitinophagaceae bacterium]|nr:Error-prone repair protein ImuA [Chitinophagaceae bacterium]
MSAHNADTVSRLRTEILRWQGLKSPRGLQQLRLAGIEFIFPNGDFPLRAIHEFLSSGRETAAATSGFIAALLSALMKNSGAAVWISGSTTSFAPGFKFFGIEPHQFIFLTANTEKEKLWLTEEALKCEGLAAVITELKELSFPTSRRFQLATETSGVTGFIISQSDKRFVKKLSPNCAAARWRIRSMPSGTNKKNSDLPGIGFPAWNVELLRLRNGRPGHWQLQWIADHLELITQQLSTEEIQAPILKAG